jgi:hypothetical protein
MRSRFFAPFQVPANCCFPWSNYFIFRRNPRPADAMERSKFLKHSFCLSTTARISSVPRLRLRHNLWAMAAKEERHCGPLRQTANRRRASVAQVQTVHHGIGPPRVARRRVPASPDRSPWNWAAARRSPTRATIPSLVPLAFGAIDSIRCTSNRRGRSCWKDDVCTRDRNLYPDYGTE